MKKRSIGFMTLAIILLGAKTSFSVTALTDPIQKAKLPSNQWVFEKKEKTEGPAKIMYVKKTGQAVNLRIHTYEVPVSAKGFIEQVRLKIIDKPDYAGADVRTLTSKEAGGKIWDCFDLTRKDEIGQEICARKTDPGVVMMIIYTAAGDYYKQYYPEYTDWLKKMPTWLDS